MEVKSLISSLRVELGLEVAAGKGGLDRRITGAFIQKTGLTLTGFVEIFRPGRIQVIGHTEMDYLWSLSPADRKKACTNLVSLIPPAVVITRGLEIPEQLVLISEEFNVPLLITGLRSSIFIDALHKFLSNKLARTRSIHGVLVDVFGVGVLIIGKSGIGKSECALELIMKGHRLVADDVVEISKKPPATIIGSGNELVRHNMEIRGLGIINIKDLFGISAIREIKRIDLVVLFEEWKDGKTYDRLGIDENTYDILGVPVSKIVIPVRPGRSLTSIVEVAARNQLLKVMGHHSAMEFQQKMEAGMGKNNAGRTRHSLVHFSDNSILSEEEIE